MRRYLEVFENKIIRMQKIPVKSKWVLYWANDTSINISVYYRDLPVEAFFQLCCSKV
jgi:hypothetical protein